MENYDDAALIRALFDNPRFDELMAQVTDADVLFFHRINYVLLDDTEAEMNIMEHAVRLGNWKMVGFILYALSADPQQNKFDGIVQTIASYYDGNVPPEEVEGFDGTPIPGFDGLRAIADYFLEGEELEKMLSFLWLSQWVTEPGVMAGTMRSREVIVKAIRSLRQLLDHLSCCEATIASLKETILTTQAVCRKYADGRLEDAVVFEILTHVCQNFVGAHL
jgi:hypothetical protein